MAKFKLNKKARNILAIVLSLLIGLGAIFGVVALTKTLTSEKKRINPLFSIGALDKEGNYIETDDSIYTKDLIACEGLSIETKFDSSVEYKLFYYDYNKDFISADTVVRSTNYTLSNKETWTRYVKYCRIVIYPDMQGKSSLDFKITFWEISQYANDLTIKVNREQNAYPTDLAQVAVKKTYDAKKSIAFDDGYFFYPGYYLSGTDVSADEFATAMTRATENGRQYAVLKIPCYVTVPNTEFGFDIILNTELLDKEIDIYFCRGINIESCSSITLDYVGDVYSLSFTASSAGPVFFCLAYRTEDVMDSVPALTIYQTNGPTHDDFYNLK